MAGLLRDPASQDTEADELWEHAPRALGTAWRRSHRHPLCMTNCLPPVQELLVRGHARNAAVAQAAQVGAVLRARRDHLAARPAEEQDARREELANIAALETALAA